MQGNVSSVLRIKNCCEEISPILETLWDGERLIVTNNSNDVIVLLLYKTVYIKYFLQFSNKTPSDMIYYSFFFEQVFMMLIRWRINEISRAK